MKQETKKSNVRKAGMSSAVEPWNYHNTNPLTESGTPLSAMEQKGFFAPNNQSQFNGALTKIKE